MADSEFCRVVAQGVVMGCIFAVLLIVFIFVTGQTFGQRCHKLYPDGDEATVTACVHKLADSHHD